MLASYKNDDTIYIKIFFIINEIKKYITSLMLCKSEILQVSVTFQITYVIGLCRETRQIHTAPCLILFRGEKTKKFAR